MLPKIVTICAHLDINASNNSLKKALACPSTCLLIKAQSYVSYIRFIINHCQ